MALLRHLFFSLCFLLSTPSFSSELKKSSALSTLGSDFLSPVTTPAWTILAVGAAATSLAYFTRNDDNYKKRDTFEQAKPLKDFGFIGEYLGYGILNIGYIGWAYTAGKLKNDEELLLNAEIMTRASMFASGLTMLGKSTISERRPGYPDDDNSFPSGHASGAFSFASVIAARHGWGWGGAAYGLAGMIAVSRVNDDFHYLHDILAGITLGAAYGWGVHYNASRGSRVWMTLIPTPRGGAGFALGSEF